MRGEELLGGDGPWWLGHGFIPCLPRSVYFYVERSQVLYVGSAERTCACLRDHRHRLDRRPFAFDTPIVLSVPPGVWFTVRAAEQALMDLTFPTYNDRRALAREWCWGETYGAATDWVRASIEDCWIKGQR